MQMVTTIGLDIAKSVFQVHGVDAAGQVVIRRQLKRRYVLAFFEKLLPCLVGIEACASSHHWSRELQSLGHTVRLMPPAGDSPRVSCRSRQPVADAEGPDTGVRPADYGLASFKRDEQAAGCDAAASVRPWRQRWSPALPIPRPYDRHEISRPGSGSCRRRTRAGARTSLAVSANRAIAICAACSRVAHLP